MEGFTDGNKMILTSVIVLFILSVTIEATTEDDPFLEAVFMVEDYKSSDHLTLVCPATQNDEVDLFISKSHTYLNFSRLVTFRPGVPCQVMKPCKDSIPLQCSYCGDNPKEKQVFAAVSRQSTNLEAYKCHYLKTNGDQLYLLVEKTTTETNVYKISAIALSCILGCFLLGVCAVLVKRCRAGNYSLVGTNLCWLNKTRTEDSVITSDDSVIQSQRSRRYTNEDVSYMDTCFSEIATSENGPNTQ
ncbi:unnamed protein product [Lymnaea stagnalis]|uniref:Uncharacterized protein n=1 Tax=Lymnaea stagnalis TaxID=6523 RepID=A0AAV2HI78_LYMST